MIGAPGCPLQVYRLLKYRPCLERTAFQVAVHIKVQTTGHKYAKAHEGECADCWAENNHDLPNQQEKEGESEIGHFNAGGGRADENCGLSLKGEFELRPDSFFSCHVPGNAPRVTRSSGVSHFPVLFYGGPRTNAPLSLVPREIASGVCLVLQHGPMRDNVRFHSRWLEGHNHEAAVRVDRDDQVVCWGNIRVSLVQVGQGVVAAARWCRCLCRSGSRWTSRRWSGPAWRWSGSTPAYPPSSCS